MYDMVHSEEIANMMFVDYSYRISKVIYLKLMGFYFITRFHEEYI